MEKGHCFNVKCYSKYMDNILAPHGFESNLPPPDLNKWIHYPINSMTMFNIRVFEGSNMALMNICSNYSEFLEEILVTLDHTSKNKVQFSARSPSISCKYLILKKEVQIMKRFQLTFFNEQEFETTLNLLKLLGLTIKGAKLAIEKESRDPSNNMSHLSTLPNAIPFPIGSQIIHDTFSIDKSTQRIDTVENKTLIENKKIHNDEDSGRNNHIEELSHKQRVGPILNEIRKEQFQEGENTLVKEPSSQEITKKLQESKEKSPFAIAEGSKPTNEEDKEANNGRNKKIGTPIRISKKKIKQKLKDRNFMKWVDKVELELIKMTGIERD